MRFIEGPAPAGAEVGRYCAARRCAECGAVSHRSGGAFVCSDCGACAYRVISIRYWWVRRSLLGALWRAMTGLWNADGFEAREMQP